MPSWREIRERDREKARSEGQEPDPDGVEPGSVPSHWIAIVRLIECTVPMLDHDPKATGILMDPNRFIDAAAKHAKYIFGPERSEEAMELFKRYMSDV